ncbi:MAG: FkbM family methyltransferase [Rhizobiales bacterium]|nr:FkbM family methyltransferase [Hyphomicrobiales bacterium]
MKLSKLFGEQEQADALLDIKNSIHSLSKQVSSLQQKLARIEAMEHGGRATYVGNGRVLSKATFQDFSLSYLVPGSDRLIAPHLITHGEHEPEIADYFITHVKKTDHCVDIGANFGFFTALMARLATEGHTIGIEPDPETFALMRDNIYINFLEGRAEAICGAISNQDGSLTLHRRDTRPGNTSIIVEPTEKLERMGEAPSVEFSVPSYRIDSLLDRMSGRIDHVKIDVEGAEPLAFAGIGETLKANPKIQIIMEWAPGQIRSAGFDAAQFTRDLEQLGLYPTGIAHDGNTWSLNYGYLLSIPYMSGVLLRLKD